MRTGSIPNVRATTAVVSVDGMISAIRMAVRTGLVRRTIQSHVYTEASLHRHCTPHHEVTASTEVVQINYM